MIQAIASVSAHVQRLLSFPTPFRETPQLSCTGVFVLLYQMDSSARED